MGYSFHHLKINQGQSFDWHPDLSKEAQAAFFIKTEGGINRIRLSEDGNEDGMGFYFYRRLSPDQKWSVPLYSACRLNDQTLRALAEAPAQRPADDPHAWDKRSDPYLTQVKRFVFNVLLFLGSLPEEYEPDQVLRPAREKKGRFRSELRAARFLGKEGLTDPSNRPEGKAEHEPTGRKLPGHWRAGHWRRQAFGEGSLQRKLIWIQPYKTTGPESDA